MMRLQREGWLNSVGWLEQQNKNKLDGFVKQISNYATWLQHEIFLIECK